MEEIPEQFSSDSEDETSINVVGNIPREWYDEFDHIGWTPSGDKVIPKERKDLILEMMMRSMDKEAFQNIFNPDTGEYQKPSAELLDFITKYQQGKITIPGFNMYQEFHDTENPDRIHPVTNKMEPKRRFQPSRSDIYKISKFAERIRNGTLDEPPSDDEDENVDIWTPEHEVRRQKRLSMPAPKMAKPGTRDSYNMTGGARLMQVSQWKDFLFERYDRFTDLFLRPRKVTGRLPDHATDLLPELPDRSELRPFPTSEAIRYVGHTGRVRCIDISHDGTLLVSGSADGELRLWEVITGRCLQVWKLNEEQQAVTTCAFLPENRVTLNSPVRNAVACTCGRYCFYIRLSGDDETNPVPKPKEDDDGGREVIELFDPENPNIVKISYRGTAELRQVCFSRGGRFMALLGQDRNIHLYRTEIWDVRTPITSKGSRIQCVHFHPEKTALYVATQHHIYLFDLVEKRKLLSLRPTCQWISSIDVHRHGDHVMAGSYDGRSFWFDTELSAEPFKVLRAHSGATRSVAYSTKFPLFATCADDATIDVYHGQVYDDLITNPLIVPVKELTGHSQIGSLGVLCLKWHHDQPWLFSGGADHTIRLWV